MRFARPIAISVALLNCSINVAQVRGETESQNPAATGTLQITKTILSTDTTTSFAMALECDADGNVYLKSDSDGFPSIHKISPKGERTATFVPSSCSDIKVHLTGNFFVAADGRVYQLAFPSDGMQQFVLVFDDDGTCHSKIKLDTPFHFMPYQLVTFPSGNMLISGMGWRAQLKRYMPYTALFSSSGTILKEVDLDSDPQKPPDVAGKAVGENERAQLHSVSGGTIQLAADDNAYLMRREAAPTIYAISEGATVTRRFRVDPGEPDMVAEGMQIAGNRMAILFRDPNGHRGLIQIVDLEGKEMAQYSIPTQNGRSILPFTFTCYTNPPEAFTFLDTTKDDKVVLETVEPR